LAQFNIDDTEIAILEMLQKGLRITLDSACVYMGFHPIECLPVGDGELPTYIYNNKQVYSHIHRLREIYIKWYRKYRIAYKTLKNGYEIAVYKWKTIPKEDNILYKDVMSYEEFINLRVQKEGLMLLPIYAKDGRTVETYAIPNKEEERQWFRKNVKDKGKGFIKVIETGESLGHIEIDKKTRKLMDKITPDKMLRYKEDLDE